MALMISAPAINESRCNPFGHESGGPKHLVGGMYGPEYEGGHKWTCHNAAEVRVRMVCTLYGHEGPVMRICRSHMAEIQRRQAGLCTRCAYPPEAIEWVKSIESTQRSLAELAAAGRYHSSDGLLLRQKIEAAGHRMTELYRSGRIKRTALRLVEIS